MSDKRSYRCAVYTRKSTEEGLEQEFNSLDAQREACEAYVASQAGVGWKLIATRYDDGGISGGTLERPALQRLLTDIKSAAVDVVVVYKIDRLTRSLMDFAKIVEVFDARGVSFVSITQQFNTTTSMGRLTLNVLLSFAQFEREVTAERIRDKIASSKRKGMWMGGLPPLGFDVKQKQLVVNQDEAAAVRRLFDLYLEVRSVRRLQVLADKAGITTKRRLTKGAAAGGKSFSRGNLYGLLANPLYVGDVGHKGQKFSGLHQPIVDRVTWNAVQALLAANGVNRSATKNEESQALLTSLLFDETGDRLSTSHTLKGGRRYHYYVSFRLMDRLRKTSEGGWRLPAQALERPVLAALAQRLSDEIALLRLLEVHELPPQTLRAVITNGQRLARELRGNDGSRCRNLLRSFVDRVEVHPERLTIAIDCARLRDLLLPAGADAPSDDRAVDKITIDLPLKLQRRGVEAKLIVGGVGDDPRRDERLLAMLAKAHRWLEMLISGQAGSIAAVAAREKVSGSEISRFLPFAFLAPDIVEQILTGTQPANLTIEKLRHLRPLPSVWTDQRALLSVAS